MPDKHYAWSELVYDVKRDEVQTNLILERISVKPGEEVTASKLGISEDEFQHLVDIGSVRNYPFPKELQDPAASPNQLIARGLAESETVAATYGVSPELVQSYSAQRKKEQTPTQGEVKAKP